MIDKILGESGDVVPTKTSWVLSPKNIGEEVRQILEALGPDPLVPMPKKMTYKFKYVDIPPLSERGYKNLPELVAKIHNLGPSIEEAGTLGVETDAIQVAKALLFYAADALDESHSSALRISMSKKYKDSAGMTKADSNYAHALLHRQEGDILGPEGISKEHPDGLSGWINSKGWFGRTKLAAKGEHPLYPAVLVAARKLAGSTKFAEKLTAMQAWDPDAFIDFCEEATAAKDQGSLEFVRQLINTEWKMLLEHVLAKANVQIPQAAKATAA